MSHYNRYTVTLTGTSPLLCHNGQTADPLNPFSKKMKSLSAKRPKTDADLEKMREVEFHAGLYVDEAGEITMDTRVIEATVHGGAKKTKQGKDALAAMFIEHGVDFQYAGPRGITERYADPKCALVVPVKVGMAKVMRCRPIFHDWSLTFDVSVMGDMVNEESLKRWLDDAGQLVGIGDWRPRYGRFVVTQFEEVRLPIAA